MVEGQNKFPVPRKSPNQLQVESIETQTGGGKATNSKWLAITATATKRKRAQAKQHRLLLRTATGIGTLVSEAGLLGNLGGVSQSETLFPLPCCAAEGR